MRWNSLFLICCLIVMACDADHNRKPRLLRVVRLLDQMTWTEKIGQLSMSHVPVLSEKIADEIRAGKVGAILNGRTSFYSRKERDSLQYLALGHSRLGIPILFGHDVIHGFRTIFPISLAQSSTWDTALVRQAAKVAAQEAYHAGVNWAFSPMVDVSRDPRWGRVAECYGEDPFLNAVFGSAVVRGYQGKRLDEASKMAACLKHYIGYGASEGGRDYDYTEISKQTLNEVYLPPFEVGLSAGAESVMSAFNNISGLPATGNVHVLRGLLKDEMAFKGVVLSDWDAVAQLKDHGLVATNLDAAQVAIGAGVDMEMKTKTFFQLDSANENHLKWVNESVRRVLRLKERLGLFEKPHITAYPHSADTLHRSLARRVARQSMVLLKNKSETLPIKNNSRIAVVGPFAHQNELMGWWKSMGRAEDVITPFQGLSRTAVNQVKVNDRIDQNTDLIVACVGEPADWFGENNNRAFLGLPDTQEEWVRSLKKYGKPIVLVIFNGRPLTLTNIMDHVDAILVAWHPGIEAGNAVADLLYGKESPSGKLTMSWPRSVGQVPLYYNRRTSGRPSQISYKDEEITPLFPFGFGLSYTQFDYSEPKLDRIGTELRLSVIVKNVGSRSGDEVVQFYQTRKGGGLTYPSKELIGFEKVQLEAGEREVVTLTLENKENSVTYYVGSNSVKLVIVP